MPSILSRISSIKNDPVKALQVFNLMRFFVTLSAGIALAKSGLPTGDISLYESWLFFGNLLTFFWMGGGQNALVSLYPKLENPEHRKVLLFQSFVLFTSLALVACALLVFAGSWIGPRFTNEGHIPSLGLLCIFILGNAPAQLVQLHYLLENKARAILVYGGLSFGLQLVAILLPLILGVGVKGIFTSLAIWAVFKWCWLLVLVLRHGIWIFDFSQLRHFAWLMLPLTLHILVGNSVEYTDGLIVANYFGDEKQFALFRFGARELPITMLLVGGIVTGMVPVLARDMEAGLSELRKRVSRLAHWLFPLSGLLMFLSVPVFPMVYNGDFAISAKVFNIYLLFLCSRILLPQVVIIGKQRNFVLVYSAIFETALNIVLSLWWVRYWGLQGIAMASALAFMLNKFNLMAYNYWALGIPPGRYIPIRLWSAYSLGLVLCYLASIWIYD
ncbi:MAG: oligosaccharide flippase family protein [Saprospirales bacterium]|nr:oligosaccharide flippase family protein [Saprospirales bacterium]